MFQSRPLSDITKEPANARSQRRASSSTTWRNMTPCTWTTPHSLAATADSCPAGRAHKSTWLPRQRTPRGAGLLHQRHDRLLGRRVGGRRVRGISPPRRRAVRCTAGHAHGARRNARPLARRASTRATVRRTETVTLTAGRGGGGGAGDRVSEDMGSLLNGFSLFIARV